VAALFSTLFRALFPRYERAQIARPQPSPLLRSLLEPPPSNIDIIKQALQDHDAIDCELRGKNEVLLPLSLVGDRITVADFALGYADKPRKRSLSIRSPRHVSIQKVECSPDDLERLRFATMHGLGVEISYLDDNGAEITAEISPPIEERGDFFLAGDRRIRSKWIQSVWEADGDDDCLI
jgi:hypothetical protein